MAKLYPITLYYNTKYNTGRIPDSPDRLNAFTSKTFPPVFLRQDYGLASVKIDATWHDVMDADYAKLESAEGSTYWVIPEAPKMLTDHTAQINMVMDPLTTVGGIGKITVEGGWAVRAHVTEDPLFGNVLPEPWAPSNALKISGRATLYDRHGHKTLPIVAATCDLLALKEYKSDLFKDADSDFSVVVPHIPGIPVELLGAEGSGVGMTHSVGEDAAEAHAYTLPGIALYNLTDAVRVGLGIARSIGVDGSVIAMYQLPFDDVKFDSAHSPGPGGSSDTSADYAALAKGIAGKYSVESPNLPYKYGNVKNNKAIALYNYYKLTSITSGDSSEFDAAELYSGGDAPTFGVQIDPSPSGTAYCSPTYYEGSPTKRLENAVAGLPWISAGFTYTENSGGDMGILNARRKNSVVDASYAISQNVRDIEQKTGWIGSAGGVVGGIANVITGVVSAVATGGASLLTGGIGGGVGQIASGTEALLQRDARLNANQQSADLQREYQMGDNMFSAQVSGRVVSPQIAFPVSPSAAYYYGNAFELIHVGLSENDLKRLDDFLSAYGYARDTKFIESMLSNRQNHNYIKTSGCQVSAPNTPRWILDSICAMFDRGVDIWHVTPSLAATYDNPVRS